MADIYSTNFLMKVVEQLNRPSRFLLDTYFPDIQVFDTEEVNFDLVTTARRLAPLVSPVLEGQIVQETGMTAKSIKPAYVKPKTPLAPSGALKRRAGEQIGGNLSSMDRQMARVVATIQDQVDQITRRKEWMAASALRSGAITLSGDKYPTQNIDFTRNAAHTVTLAGAAAWGQAGVDPLADIRAWVNLVLKNGSVGVADITMDADAWELFFASQSVKDQLGYRRDVAAAFSSRFQSAVGGTYQGSIGGLNFYMYSEWYVDDAGATQPMLPSKTVLMAGPGLEGVQAHGAIQDDAAGLVALEYFPKSWVPQDPAVRQVMTQSAPLVIPCNVNGSLAATVG